MNFEGHRQPVFGHQGNADRRALPFWGIALGVRQVAAARPARVAQIAEALSGLLAGAMEQHRQILAEESALDLIRETGQLYLYRDRAQYAKDAEGWALRQRHGMRIELLEGREAIRALEPDMQGDYELGLFLPEQGSSVNPLRQAQVVARGVERLGGSRALQAAVQQAPGIDAVRELFRRAAPAGPVASGPRASAAA